MKQGQVAVDNNTRYKSYIYYQLSIQIQSAPISGVAESYSQGTSAFAETPFFPCLFSFLLLLDSAAWLLKQEKYRSPH